MKRAAAIAAFAYPVLVGAQVSTMPAIPGVPGKVDAALDLLVCFEWDQATPFPVACPVSTPSSPVTGGCVSVEINGDPVVGMTLHDFDISFADFPQQTAAYFTQGTIDYVITGCTLRMSPGAQPITGVYSAPDDHFVLTGIPIELEGQLLITGTSGEAGDAFPVSSMELAEFVFPDASGAMTTTTDPDSGDIVVVLSVLVGAPFAQPGGRLDVGSGFIVGIGGGALSVATGDSCSTQSCAGDTNGDDQLTPADFTAWINAFNNNLPQCDQNGDEVCTPTDFTAWIANFNAGC